MLPDLGGKKSKIGHYKNSHSLTNKHEADKQKLLEQEANKNLVLNGFNPVKYLMNL